MVRQRGRVSNDSMEAFFAAGWAEQQVLEVILAISIKTMSNYTNAIADVPLDRVVHNER